MLFKIMLNHIHLWQIPLNLTLPDLLDHCKAILPADEQKRADRFIFEKHHRRFVFAHFALRKILSNYINITPENIEFTLLSHGKPEILKTQNPNNIEFNLSHSGETALVGLRTEKTIGVDIEYHSVRELLGIAQTVFSDAECQSLLEAHNSTELTMRFFHVWAQKEAFIKAKGMGLSYPLKDFTVSATAPAKLIEAKHENITDWYLHSFQSTPDAHSAFATLNPVEKIHYFDFSYQ
jgi:4'-phosphopantetheinyl transferase